ncbi:hypothetical protein COCOBI_04-8000 [Coccomyxa sp. Obi]|nr:hypothetical protein COCOBI_04-8000 [Coccomyxa sp. Obi]
MPTTKIPTISLSLLRDIHPVRAVTKPFLSHSKCNSRAALPQLHIVVTSNVAADILASRSYGNTDSSRSDIKESSHSAEVFAGLFGEYRLNAEQFSVFEDFSRTIRECALAFLCVAATNITLTLLQALSKVAFWAVLCFCKHLHAFTMYVYMYMYTVILLIYLLVFLFCPVGIPVGVPVGIVGIPVFI